MSGDSASHPQIDEIDFDCFAAPESYTFNIPRSDFRVLH
jgi:hypothetical protein